jgi:hypothetical protein
MLDTHLPRLAPGLLAEDREVAGEAHEGTLDAVLAQHRRGAIDGVLLPEAAEVELHAGEWQANGRGVRSTRLHPISARAARARVGGTRGVSNVQARRRTPTSGRMRHRSGGSKPRRSRGAARFLVDRDRLARRRRVDPRDDAIGPIARVLRLDAMDFVDGGARRGRRSRGIARSESGLVFRRHRAERDMRCSSDMPH